MRDSLLYLAGQKVKTPTFFFYIITLDYSQMKKILFSLLATAILTSCNSSGGSGDEPLFYTYETGDFSMDIPDTWEIVTAFNSSYPDGIQIAFKNNVKTGDFVANVNIINERNAKNLTNADLSQRKLKDNAGTLINYKLEESEEIYLKLGTGKSSTFLNTFTGKNEEAGYTFKFIQTYLANGNDAWIITATYVLEEDEFVIERMDKMLRSFTLK